MTELAGRISGLSPEQRELLLRRLAARTAAGSTLALPALLQQPGDRLLPFPLTDIQEVYWAGRSGYFDLSTPGTNVYLEYEVQGNVDAFLDRFEKALASMLDRHDILRLIVSPDGDQRYLAQAPPPRIERIDLRGLDPAEVQRRLAELREHFRYHEGPAGSWPLFGLTAHRLEEDRALLHVWMDCWLIDGLSRERLERDLFHVFYHPEEPLPPQTCTYRDYALARRQHRSTELYQRSRAWWLKRIPQLPPPPELPLARPLSPRVRTRFQTEFVPLLDADGWQRLKERAARHQLTASSPLIAAFIEVLRAWSRQPRFTLSLEGTYWPPIHPEIRSIVGNFNTVYIFSADDLEGSFADRARRVQRQLSQLLEHRTFSGFEVLREIRRRQGGGTHSLMPVLFNSLVEYIHPSYVSEIPWGPSDSRILQLEVGGHPPQLLVMPTIYERLDHSLECKLQVVASAFPNGFVPALRDAFVQLLRRLADRDETWQEPHFELAHEVQLAQRQPGFQAFPPPEPATLPALVVAQALAWPDRPAVVSPELQMTYRELLARAQRLACRLQRAGARPEQPVALALDRGWQQAVAVLGTLMSGACCLAVDPAMPGERLRALLRRYGVRLAAARAGICLQLRGNEEVVWLALEDELEEEPLNAEHAPRLDSLAYVSDADGEGVMVEHRAAAHAVVSLGRRLGLGSADRLLSLSPPASDFALFEILGPLAAGGTVVLPAAGEDRPAAWGSLAGSAGITTWCGPPLVMERMIARSASLHAPESLRLALLARGTVPVTLADRLRALSPGLRVVWLAGAPEAAFASTVHPVSALPDDAVWMPAGRPAGECTALVLDHALAQRPDLVTGPLYLGGPTLARGYWGDEAGAPTRLLVHPRTGERLVRSGLLGRYLDGTVEILGPEEEHLHRFGCCVELRRIEAALERQPGIRAAAVQAWTDGGRTRLVAYVVPFPGISLSLSGIADHLGAALPAYLRPDRYAVLDELPLRGDGTLDRSALAPPEESPAPSPAPPAELEEEVASLVGELLGACPAPTDNFFELGGDSFTAVLLLERIHRRFGSSGDLSPFFFDPTVRCLARTVHEARFAVPAEPSANLEVPR